MGQMRVRRTGPWVKISCPFSWVQFRNERVETTEQIGQDMRNMRGGKAPKALKTAKRSAPIHFVISRSCVRVTPPAPKCVDERCNAENAAQKCGVFTYNAPLLERKSCKNSIFQNFSFAQREATFWRCALPDLWSGVVRTPRLKKE